ncbi:MAG TPA: ATP-binding protein [Terriglobales bacterium]|nr:ATP-binding protein [Terriglobales bacterium]
MTTSLFTPPARAPSFPAPDFPPPVHGDEQFLLQAFSSFAEAAGSLEHSYGLLRGEVSRLRCELEESNGGLARSLEENRTMRQHLDRILEGLPCGVLVVAENGEISRVNPEGRRLLAPDNGPEPFPAHISGIGSELRELLDQARAQAGEHEQKVSNGPECWLAVRHAALPEVGAQSSVFILRDISESKRLERAEQRLLREQALGEMSAVLAHEIRNPLGSLELFAGLLAEAELSRESREWVEQMQAGLRSLAATVNNVLNFHCRPEAASAPTDLGQLLDWAHDFLAPLARRARVKINLRHRLAGVMIPGDRHRLEQVLLNLLLNGVHALPGGGWMELAGGTAPDGESVRITVRDTGPGIDAECLPKIFDPGFSTRLGSPGMGLAVCRKIVEQHGGAITAASRPGQGAVFTLTFPLARPSAGSGSGRKIDRGFESTKDGEVAG